MAVVVQFILFDFAAKSVAMESQLHRGPRLVAASSIENFFDEAFFKFSNGFVEQNAVLDHLHHQTFQLILHVATLRKYFVKFLFASLSGGRNTGLIEFAPR